MYVTCCNKRMTISVTDDLRDDRGHPTYGVFRPGDGIYLDSGTPRSERREVLVHELGHAYEYLVGQVDAEDGEGRQNRLATMESQFAADLTAQGGEAALHAMFGDLDPDPVADEFGETHYSQDDEMAEWPTSIWCPSCHEAYPSRAVRNGKPAFNPRLNAFMLKRLLVCAKCGRETRWGQRCTYDGLPLPDVVVSPTSRMLPAMA
jgi:hypothetical protein